MTATKKTHAKSTKTATTKKAGKKSPKAKATKPAAGEKDRPMSALDAAARVLSEKGVAMTCRELIGVMAARGYWSSPNGKTPAATLYAAVLRELATKGDNARFKKTAPGRFAAKDAPVATNNADSEATAEKPTKRAKTKKAGKAMTMPAVAAEIPDGTPGPESVSELFRI